MFGNVWKSYVNDVVSSSPPISANSIQYSLIVYGLYIIYSLYLCNNWMECVWATSNWILFHFFFKWFNLFAELLNNKISLRLGRYISCSCTFMCSKTYCLIRMTIIYILSWSSYRVSLTVDLTVASFFGHFCPKQFSIYM